MGGTLSNFQEMKYNDPESYRYLKLDVKRRNDLIEHPEKKLPSIENLTMKEEKFTEYLFGGSNEDGLAKGVAFKSRL